jgi:uncharacterized damage-inducible protein DinB
MAKKYNPMKRPQPQEHIPYFAYYINLVKDDNCIKVLENQIIDMQLICSQIPEDFEEYRYKEGKWNIKEVLGHITDTERIFGYRAMAFVRNDKTNLPGYDEDAYVNHANFSTRKLSNIVHEFSLIRESNLALFKTFSEEQLNITGTANGNNITVRALLFVMAGHVSHHIQFLRKNYLSQLV